MQLTLSDRDVDVLYGLLRDYLPDLMREVARTDRHDLRRLLRERQELAERLLEQCTTGPRS
jgi:hypothetical protein